MALTITRPSLPVPLTLARGGTEATTPAGARTKLELGDLALLTAPGGTTTFLRADKTWAVPPGGGGGGGDVSSGTGLSVDTELVVFDGTTGKLIKRGTGTGLANLTNGVLGIKAAPTGAVVGTTDAQTLTGKTIAGASNTLSIREADLVFTDVTTRDVSLTAHGLTPKAPGGTTLFLRGDATWAVPPGGGGGGGDVSSGTGLSVDTELVVFDGTTGKLIKRGTGTGLANLTNGVLGIKAAPTGAVVGTTDAQTLTGKTIAGASNTLSIREADLVFTDVTTRDVSLTAHGLTPKAPGGTTLFLRGDATWAVPAGGGGGAPTDAEYITSTVNASLSAERVLTDTATITWDRTTAGEIKANAIGGGGYTDEQAQDAVGAILLGTATIDLTYLDATPSLSAAVKDASITEAKLSLSDVTTRDASTTAHGLLRKLSGTATEYLNGAGAWATPAGGGENYWSRVDLGTNSLASTILAFWPLEEATGNRLDSVSGLALVPTGTTAQVSNGPGKIGQALAMNGTPGTYLSLADNPTFSAGPNMSFTLACWVYVIDTGANMGFVGKGSAAVSSNNVEYLLWQYNGTWHFQVGNGSAFVLCTSSFAPVANQWCLLIGWYDHVAGLQYIQVNDGTPVQVANTGGSYDSALPFEVGRTVGFPSQSLNGRIDLVAFDKRVWTPAERAAYWNNGNGLAYPFTLPSCLSPTTIGDQVLLAATALTTERLEVETGIKLGNSTGTTDGTLRWSGTDFEGRKGGAWVSMTSGGGGQPLDATLTALAGLATGADQLPYSTGTDTFAQTPLTAFARTLLDDTTQAAMRTTLGLTPGTDVQAQDAELTAIAGLTSAADRVPYFTGSGTAALAPFTAAGRALAGGADAAAQRTALGLGTLAQQNANAVAITGGTAGLATATVGWGAQAGYMLSVDRLYAAGLSQFLSGVGLGGVPSATVRCWLYVHKSTQVGLRLQPIDTDTGAAVVQFLSLDSADVGSITTTASATAYNTTSDVRLKHAITPLTGALATLAALRPVRFRWNANDEPGEGFLAHELMQHVPTAVTGEPEEMNPDGTIKPQQVDHSRVVPWLTAALQELLVRVDNLETQLGL